LLATPVIALAGLLEVPSLLSTHDHPVSNTTQLAALVGGLVAFLAALASVRWLTRYFHVGRLTPFAYYCFFAGLICFLVFAPISPSPVAPQYPPNPYTHLWPPH